jgi:hypothetical protein
MKKSDRHEAGKILARLAYRYGFSLQSHPDLSRLRELIEGSKADGGQDQSGTLLGANGDRMQADPTGNPGA